MKYILIILLIITKVFAQAPLTSPTGTYTLTGTAGEPITSYVPNQVYPSNLKLWFRSTDGITLNGASAVQGWDDLSGNTNNLSQLVGGSMPTLLYNQQNGYPAVSVRSNTKTMALSSTITLTRNSTTIFICKVVGWAGVNTCSFAPLYGTSGTTTYNVGYLYGYNSSGYNNGSLQFRPTELDPLPRTIITGFNLADAWSFVNKDNAVSSYKYNVLQTVGTESGTYGILTGFCNSPSNLYFDVYVYEICYWDIALPTSILNNLLLYYFNNRYKIH